MSNNLGWTPIAENDPIGHQVANDNFELFDAAISAAQAYDFGFTFSALPDPSSILGDVPIVRNITIPANMVGSVGIARTSPDMDYPIDVRVDDVSIGTITITSYGTFIFETGGGTAKDVDVGSVVSFVAPPASPPEASIANVSVTVRAQIRSA